MPPYIKVNCSKCNIECCLDQKVILLPDEISRIVSLGFDTEYFVELVEGRTYLKNYGGKCVFYDETSKKCKIYEARPFVCRVYPVIYKDGNIGLDIENCPEAGKVSEDDIWDIVPDLIEFVFKLKNQA